MLPFILAASFAIGPLHWNLPDGWEAQEPPADVAIDQIFQPLPAHRDGQNIILSHEPRHQGWSLQKEAEAVANSEAEDGRTIERIVQRPTCGGKQPGMEIEAKYGPIASQLFHLTVYKGQLYVLIYAYAPTGAVSPSVRRALDSICPS